MIGGLVYDLFPKKKQSNEWKGDSLFSSSFPPSHSGVVALRGVPNVLVRTQELDDKMISTTNDTPAGGLNSKYNVKYQYHGVIHSRNICIYGIETRKLLGPP